MNRNLLSKELKRNRKNLLIWLMIVMVLTFIVMSIFPYMQNIGAEMAQVMSNIPEGITKAMGIDASTWSSILGLYNTYYGIYIVVLISIFASSTGATIISKEERDGTAEFLMSKPISRANIFNTKVLALFSLTAIIYFVQVFTAFFGVIVFGEKDANWSTFITMHINGLVLTLFFTCVGVFLSMYLQPKMNFMGMVVGIVFGSYFLNAISNAAETISWIGYFSPFHYLDFSVADPDYNLNFLAITIFLSVSILLLTVSYRAYERKDIGA